MFISLSKANSRKSGGAKNLTRRGHVTTYLGEDFVDGYLIKDFRIQTLTVKDVNPTLEEITQFAGSADDGIDLTSLAADLKAAAKQLTFDAGDAVEVFEGEQTGVHGTVESVINDIATIVSTYTGLKGQRLEVPVRSLRKRFKGGDHVRVSAGRYKDDTGMVVRVVDDEVTLLSDISMKEITVFSRDLSEASQSVNINTLSKYELHDLVQLEYPPSAVRV
jgi:transcription elongation factor SPT5